MYIYIIYIRCKYNIIQYKYIYDKGAFAHKTVLKPNTPEFQTKHVGLLQLQYEI